MIRFRKVGLLLLPENAIVLCWCGAEAGQCVHTRGRVFGPSPIETLRIGRRLREGLSKAQREWVELFKAGIRGSIPAPGPDDEAIQ